MEITETAILIQLGCIIQKCKAIFLSVRKCRRGWETETARWTPPEAEESPRRQRSQDVKTVSGLAKNAQFFLGSRCVRSPSRMRNPSVRLINPFDTYRDSVRSPKSASPITHHPSPVAIADSWRVMRFVEFALRV